MKIKQQQYFEKKTYRHTHQKQQQIYKKLANDKHLKKRLIEKGQNLHKRYQISLCIHLVHDA